MLHSISTHHMTHLPSLERTGYRSYLLGIQNAFGRNSVYIGVHLLSLSKPFKNSASVPHTMFRLKSNSRSSFTPQSQGCLALMLESVFSSHQTPLPSAY